MNPLRIYVLALSVVAPIVVADELPEQNPLVEEVIVVGSRLPAESHTVGRAMTVLDQTTIHDLGYGHGADLFRHSPGIAVSRAGGYGGLTQLRLRGAESNHVVVLVDGIDVSAAGTGEFDFSSLLADDIERIEVLRGPQSGLYGSNALAGVISIHTRTPAAGFAANVNLEGGDDETRQAAVSVSGGSERVQGRLSVMQRQSAFDLSKDDSVIGAEDDEDDNTTISGQLTVHISEALSVSAFGRFADREVETDGFDFSGGPQQGLPVDDGTVNQTEDLTAGLTADLVLADGKSISRFAIERSEAELDGRTFGNDSERDQVRFDTSWLWQQAGTVKQRTTLFMQHEEESFRNLYPFDPSQVPTQSRDLFGYGLEHRVDVNGNLFLNAVVRQDENDEFDDDTTYSFDVAYIVNDGTTRLHASYGTGVANPTFFEQYGFVPGTFVGNPQLKPETSRGWDAGVEQTFLDGRMQVDITYFDADLEDEIQSLFPSVVNLPGSSDRQGTEFALGYRGEVTSITASYTYTDADEPAGEEVRRPQHAASLNVARNVMQGRLRLAASLLYNGEQFDNDFRNYFVSGFVAERTELDSYTLVNAQVTYKVSDALQVYVRLENLFDESYEELIGYATPGRTAFAGLRWHIGR